VAIQCSAAVFLKKKKRGGGSLLKPSGYAAVSFNIRKFHTMLTLRYVFLYGPENKQELYLARRYVIGLQARSQNCEKRLLASSCLSVCPFAWNNSAPNGRLFMTFDILVFLKTLSRYFSFIKSDRKSGYFTCRPIYIFDHISLISS